jgi:CRISPR-associated protein Cas1
MNTTSPSEMKAILHSKRAAMYYLQHCRVLVNGGRVEYVTEDGAASQYWNIPIANTTTILLGTGTSITQAAVRELAKAGVLLGFCGGGGTPLFSANEIDFDVSWLTPQSEYRPTEHLQQWVRFWFSDDLRLAAARAFQRCRLEQIRMSWLRYRGFVDGGFSIHATDLDLVLRNSLANIEKASTNVDLLTEEARLTKQLYKTASRAVAYGEFTRAKRGSGTDPANGFLDHGNYLAYGLAATATWVLGLPQGLSVMHGKTRRGGLVFDVADLVKDALVLPQAFISAARGDEEKAFRIACLENFTSAAALDTMIDAIKAVAANVGVPT